MLQSEVKVEQPSPFANLNGGFGEQNERFGELIYRLSNKLHRLSDTNFPETKNDTKEGLPDLPFRDGHLMDFYFKVNNYRDLLNQLTILVEKAESLI